MRIRLLFNSDSSPLHGTNLAFLSFKGPLDRYFGTALDQIIALPAPDNFVVPEEATRGAGDNVTVATAAAIITRAAARLLGG